MPVYSIELLNMFRGVLADGEPTVLLGGFLRRAILCNTKNLYIVRMGTLALYIYTYEECSINIKTRPLSEMYTERVMKSLSRIGRVRTFLYKTAIETTGHPLWTDGRVSNVVRKTVNRTHLAR